MVVLEELQKVVGLEQYQGVAEESLAQLRQALQPNLERDLGLFEEEIRQTLEGEVVLRFHYAAGLVERSLTQDPTVGRALSVFGEELSGILGQAADTESAPSRE